MALSLEVLSLKYENVYGGITRGKFIREIMCGGIMAVTVLRSAKKSKRRPTFCVEGGTPKGREERSGIIVRDTEIWGVGLKF